VFTTPVKKRKDEYDFERVFARSGSWSAKLTSPVAAKGGRQDEGLKAGEEERRKEKARREKRETRRVVDEVVRKAVERAEVKVDLSSKGLSYLPTSIEDLKVSRSRRSPLCPSSSSSLLSSLSRPNTYISFGST